MEALAQVIRDEIAATGSMRFGRFLELALYTPELGFYEGVGRAGGRRGDFVTSVETGPLFAAVIGDWLDSTWRSLGCPAPFTVAEAGAGVGTLWRGIHKSQPDCLDALEYRLVERSEAQRSAHPELPGTPRSLPDLGGEQVHVIFANELLDNLAFDIIECGPDGQWRELRIDVEHDALCFVADHDARTDPAPSPMQSPTTPSPQPSPPMAPSLTESPSVPPGTRLPVPTGAIEWIGRAQNLATRLLCFDYTATDAELIERGMSGWLRTYDRHRTGIDPLGSVGECDITSDVAIDRLPPPTRVATQADWLRVNGIESRVETARKTWEARRHVGDLDALYARSAITEANALLDPDGLGGFTVMEWHGDPGF